MRIPAVWGGIGHERLTPRPSRVPGHSDRAEKSQNANDLRERAAAGPLVLCQRVDRTREEACAPEHGLVSTGWEAGSAYRSSKSVKVKVLDFVKSGGPELTVGRTIFELWLVSL